MERRAFMASVGTGLLAATSVARSQSKSYTLETDDLGKILKTPDGRVVFEYMTKKPDPTPMSANSVCCFHPLNTPGGEPITVFGVGHAHYRGLFFAWHTVEFHEKCPALAARGRGGRGQGRGPGGAGRGSGADPGLQIAPTPAADVAEVTARTNAPCAGDMLRGDYWGWGRYAPMVGRVIQNRDVHLVSADDKAAEIAIQNDWFMNDQTLLQESTSAKVHEVPGAFVLDLTYRFTPTTMDMLLNEWSFGGLCLAGRSDAAAGSGYYQGPDGKISLPNPGMVDGNTDWPDAAWYSRTGTLASGKIVGGAVVNHASNPPTRWWNPPSTGDINPSIVTYKDVAVGQGETLTLRYRVITFDGDVAGSRIEPLASEWRNS